MGRLAKISLGLMAVNAVAAVLFLSGVIDVSRAPGLYLTFPLAALFYGMFVIFVAFEKQAARSEAEQHIHHGHDAPEIHPHNVESLHGHDHHDSVAA